MKPVSQNKKIHRSREKKKNQEPVFIFFQKFDLWDKITIGLYILVTCVLLWFFLRTSDAMSRQNMIRAYGFGTQFFLYSLNYKSMRNFGVYLVWISFALVHLVFYFYLQDVQGVSAVDENPVNVFRGTLPLLLLYQLLRFASIRIQGLELVSVSRSKELRDIFDERGLTLLDVIFFFVYLGAMVLLM